MTTTTKQKEATSASWLPILVGLTAAGLVITDQGIRPLLGWWAWPLVAILAGVVAWFITIIQMAHGGEHGWFRVFVFRIGVVVAFGIWTTWVDLTGFTISLGLWWLGGTAALAALGLVCGAPLWDPAKPAVREGGDRRPALVQEWEARIRSVTHEQVTVVGLKPWARASDGFRLFLELPADKGMTDADLALHCDRLAASARLPRHCVVQVLPGDRQGAVVLDIMTRDNLVDTEDRIYTEPATPASITDEFTVMTTPRGEPLKVCLRIETATVGGATGSGKTTLLNRIIMRLARCTDTLIWIADYNGGGLANNWIEPWARGMCDRPVVDWVATDEFEFAVMTATAEKISTSRKSNPEARRRIREARGNGVLPVSADLPAIVVLADEGGSIRQKLSPLGVIAMEGLTRIAQLGRAMAVRAMLSVLRGTSDLTDKGFRTQSSIRLCLRMNEHGEYVHVLDANPPKTTLKHKGSGYLRTMDLDQPVYGRTVNIDEDAIEAHAVACSRLRPELDPHAVAVSSTVTPSVVTNGMEKEYPGWAGSIQYRHCREGKAYTGRWERAAALLAELRGEEYAEQPAAATPVTIDPVSPAGLSGLDALEAAVTGPAKPAVSSTPAPESAATEDGARIYQFPGQQEAPATARQLTAREQILMLVQSAGATGISASDLETRVGATRSRVYALLGELRDEGLVRQDSDKRYIVPVGA